MAKIKVRKVDGHDCTLAQDEDLINLYINDGLCVNFRRKFRQYLMVSAANPQSKAVLRSTAQIRWEEARHLRNNYYMIHPFSRGRITWETIMITVYLAQFIIMPFEIALFKTPALMMQVSLFCKVMCLVDMILFFCTGYYDTNLRRIIMNPKRVFKHYLVPHFVCDFVSVIPVNATIEFTESYIYHRVKYVVLFRLVRLPTFSTYVRKFFIRMGMWDYTLKILNQITWVLILIWWGTAFIFRIYVMTRDVYFDVNTEIFSPMVECCLQMVKILGLVSESNIQIDSIPVLVAYIIMFFGGGILNMVIFAQVMQIYTRTSSSRNEYDNLVQEIGEYSNYKMLPSTMKKKIFRYIEFKFQKNVYKEDDIMDCLSKDLKKDVVLHFCRKLVKRVDIFKGLPNSLVIKIINKLRPEIYLPKDTIVQGGIQGHSMYFIYIGTVAVYASNDHEICHLEDGGHFGEISLVLNQPRVASVIAITNCEVYKLTRKDFLEVIEPDSWLYNRIKASAIFRLQNTKELLISRLSGSSPEDILV